MKGIRVIWQVFLVVTYTQRIINKSAAQQIKKVMCPSVLSSQLLCPDQIIVLCCIFIMQDSDVCLSACFRVLLPSCGQNVLNAALIFTFTNSATAQPKGKTWLEKTWLETLTLQHMKEPKCTPIQFQISDINNNKYYFALHFGGGCCCN